VTIRRVTFGATVGGVAVMSGAIATGALTLPAIGQLPRAALAVGMLLLAGLPLALERWQLAVGGFLGWLVLEDLVRKLAGNDLAVFFVKDAIFLVVLVGLLLDPEARGVLRRAAGGARLPLYALLTWGAAMSIPVAAEDWRLPLLALRLDFLYVPLVVVGYLVAHRAASLKRWLGRMAMLGGAASVIGIVQAVTGPGFLAPEGPTPGLGLLVTVRGLPDSGPIYRPSGTFVSSGRFATMALVALAISLAAMLAVRGRPRTASLVSALAAGGAVWVSGGRGGFVVGLCLVAAATAAPFFLARGKSARKAVIGVGVGVAAVVMCAIFLPGLFASRAEWYRATLDPRSAENEWAFRFQSYMADTVRGIELGGTFGQGTGKESLGKQYLSGDPDRSPEGLYQVEAGYGSVAVEWGLFGVALWLAWTVAWTARQWRCVRAARDGPLGAAGMVLFAWIVLLLFVQFFGGLATFQNYLVNAYFWLLSGMIFALPEAAAAARLEAGADE
jgi:hypothetical protein